MAQAIILEGWEVQKIMLWLRQSEGKWSEDKAAVDLANRIEAQYENNPTLGG